MMKKSLNYSAGDVENRQRKEDEALPEREGAHTQHECHNFHTAAPVDADILRIRDMTDHKQGQQERQQERNAGVSR